MIRQIKEIDEKSLTQKQESISLIRSQHSISEICEAWGISMGTYYNLLRRWGIDLTEVRRQKRKFQKGAPTETNNIQKDIPLYRISFFHEKIDGVTLLDFLQVMRERVALASGPFNAKMSIDLPEREDPEISEVSFVPFEIFKNLSMEIKINLLAVWLMNDRQKGALLKYWGIDVVRLYELLGELKVPMVKVLEEKQRMYGENGRMLSEPPNRNVLHTIPGFEKGELYELSGGFTRDLLVRDLDFVFSLIRQRAHLHFYVKIRIDEIERGHQDLNAATS